MVFKLISSKSYRQKNIERAREKYLELNDENNIFYNNSLINGHCAICKCPTMLYGNLCGWCKDGVKA